MPEQVTTPRPASPRQRRFIKVLRARAGEPERPVPETSTRATFEIDRLVRIVGKRPEMRW